MEVVIRIEVVVLELFLEMSKDDNMIGKIFGIV
jgi:hypothetical protein